MSTVSGSPTETSAAPSSKRDDLFVISLVISLLAILISIIAVGFGMRAIDESKDNVAARASEAREPAPQAEAAIELSAQNIAFSNTELSASAGEVTITFDNRDDGVPHNLHLTGTGVDEATDIETGPATQQLRVRLEPGTYTFVCDVHPQQMRGEVTATAR